MPPVLSMALMLAGLMFAAFAPQAEAFDPPAFSYIHITTGPDGASHARTELWEGAPIASKSFAGALRQYFAAKATKVFIISVKPGIQTPQHNSAGKREFSVILQGGGTIGLSDGTTQAVKAGDVVLIEDRTGPGTRIHFGAEGYVALTAVLAS